jgi:hypothetical protein
MDTNKVLDVTDISENRILTREEFNLDIEEQKCFLKILSQYSDYEKVLPFLPPIEFDDTYEDYLEEMNRRKKETIADDDITCEPTAGDDEPDMCLSGAG